MGEKLTTVRQFPPDKLCDYIFYDSLYKEGNHNLLPDPASYTESLNTFLGNHRDYRHTTLGIGFAFDFLAKAEEDLKVANHSPLEAFWNRAIFHAGILDTPIMPTRYHTKAAVGTLKNINRLLDIQRSRGATVVTAISVSHPGLSWAISFAEDFRELRFTPHLFISIGHYRLGDDKRGVCYIVPQTRDPDDIPTPDIFEDYNFNLVCPSAVARPVSSLNYSTKHHAMITYVPKIDRTFTYDNEQAFAEKLCHVKALGTDVPFGVAVYDIDYDDYYNKCHNLNIYGTHSRLKALRKVVDYFKNNTTSFNETACRTFVAG
ncbi:uncharacterized protein LOC142768632 isoform X2 [Rhipicephalus microplus]|uniref:uncharacterized protein LOC142768632 isoform X2 n=1 Tax=Rhipicephalus microplus TaxID=6941 RepID=UPI003F6B338D